MCLCLLCPKIVAFSELVFALSENGLLSRHKCLLSMKIVCLVICFYKKCLLYPNIVCCLSVYFTKSVCFLGISVSFWRKLFALSKDCLLSQCFFFQKVFALSKKYLLSRHQCLLFTKIVLNYCFLRISVCFLQKVSDLYTDVFAFSASVYAFYKWCLLSTNGVCFLQKLFSLSTEVFAFVVVG